MKNIKAHLLVVLAFFSSSAAMAGMPSSGSCAFLMTLPVPYGATVTSFGETGYNVIGKITFNSATTGSFSGRIVNPIFQTDSSPYILAKNIIDLENFAVAIETMTPGNGFTGGYKMTASGRINGAPVDIEWTAVPNNNGKSILMISSGAGTPNNPKLGPGSGVCQF
jgi:hypothetical protein